MKPNSKHYIIARILEFCIGVYFLVGALPKGMDIDKFAVQIAAYKVISAPNLLFYAAIFTLFVEVALGIALILGLRLKGLTILVMQAMLVVFAALILYAWRMYGLEDCGCFPFFKMSPQVSLIKNAFLIGFGVYIVWVFYNKENGIKSGQYRVWTYGIAKFVAAVLLGTAAAAYAYQDIDWKVFETSNNDGNQISFSQFELYLPEGYFNLGEGAYLVAIMSMTCDECMANVPRLNDLMLVPELPPLVALCYEDHPGDMELFRGYTEPAFPMHSLGDQAVLYYSLIGKDSFRLSLVNNGTAVKSWDGHVPEYTEILQNMSNLTVP